MEKKIYEEIITSPPAPLPEERGEEKREKAKIQRLILLK